MFPSDDGNYEEIPRFYDGETGLIIPLFFFFSEVMPDDYDDEKIISVGLLKSAVNKLFLGSQIATTTASRLIRHYLEAFAG